MSEFNLLQNSIERLEMARRYTNQFLVGLTPEEWFWTPGGYVTHVAWQVGHTGLSQYNLCLRRLRGRTEADPRLVPDDFIECFRLGSVPVADATKYPSIEEIQATFTAIHERVLEELGQYTEAELEVPVEQPHPVFKTKLGAVSYASLHEMVHAGQIGMLRRLMGKPTLR